MMTLEVYFCQIGNTYYVRHNGALYQRHSYIAAKELIDEFVKLEEVKEAA